MGDAFAPWHIIILVVVLVLLFGATRLPRAAKSLGQSMRIFKNEVQGLAGDDKMSAASPPEAAALPAAGPDGTQQQLLDLQRQVADLQRQAAGVSNGQAGQGQAGQGQAGQAQTHQPL